MKRFEKILVPTDFSEFADKALEQALALAQQFKARVYLLHVVNDIQQCAVDYCLSEEVVNQFRTSSVDSAKAKLQQVVAKHEHAIDVQIVPDVKIGTPYVEILNEEQAQNVDLIVIATHGKTGFLHHLMGSVAEHVSRGAKCPVMLVKP